MNEDHIIQEEPHMKYMFASDIHGSAYYCRKTLETYRQSGAARLILLGGHFIPWSPAMNCPGRYDPQAGLCHAE